MPPKKKRSAKADSLAQSGTLNPHPEKVKDSSFQNSAFFDPCDLMQVKYEMLRRVSEDGWSISDASRTFGFSRPSFYEAQGEFERAGLPGFVPKRRGPRAAHKLSGKVVAFLEKAKQDNQSLSAAALVQLVKSEFDIKVHKRSIERALARSKKKPIL
jgi:transposase